MLAQSSVAEELFFDSSTGRLWLSEEEEEAPELRGWRQRAAKPLLHQLMARRSMSLQQVCLNVAGWLVGLASHARTPTGWGAVQPNQNGASHPNGKCAAAAGGVSYRQSSWPSCCSPCWLGTLQSDPPLLSCCDIPTSRGWRRARSTCQRNSSSSKRSERRGVSSRICRYKLSSRNCIVSSA